MSPLESKYELVRNGDLYRCGHIILCPDPPEGELLELYKEWKESGVLDWVFYGEPTSLLWFLQWFSRPDHSNLAVYEVDLDTFIHRIIGLVWINQSYVLPGGFKKAEVAMGFNRDTHPDDVRRAGLMAIEWGFAQRELDALIGTTPTLNRAAVAFGRRLGFDVAGPVHGMATFRGNLASVMISSMDKPMWVAMSPFEVHNSPMGAQATIEGSGVDKHAARRGYDDEPNTMAWKKQEHQDKKETPEDPGEKYSADTTEV